MPTRITGNIPLPPPQQLPDVPLAGNGLNQRPLLRRVQSGASSLISRGQNAPLPNVTQGQGTQRGHVRELQQINPEESPRKPSAAGRTSLNARRLDQGIAPSTPLLDGRQNPVAATKRESRWAIALWGKLPTQRLELFIEHLEFMLESADHFETTYHCYSHRLPDDAARAGLLNRFAEAHVLEKLLEQWAAGPSADGLSLAELLLGDTADFKGTVDTLQVCLGLNNLANKNVARNSAFFTDRGRQKLPRERRNPSSEESPHAGITDSRNRSPSMEGVFSESVRHAKGFLQRDPDSPTAQRFKACGIPYIGGVSGSIETLLALMEALQPKHGLTDFELTERERIIALHSALLVYGGHHSLMECMLPARAYGYFREVPNPLRVGYDAAIKVLNDSMKELGMDPGVSLAE